MTEVSSHACTHGNLTEEIKSVGSEWMMLRVLSRPGHRALARSSLLRDWFPCAGAVLSLIQVVAASKESAGTTEASAQDNLLHLTERMKS